MRNPILIGKDNRNGDRVKTKERILHPTSPYSLFFNGTLAGKEVEDVPEGDWICNSSFRRLTPRNKEKYIEPELHAYKLYRSRSECCDPLMRIANWQLHSSSPMGEER